MMKEMKKENPLITGNPYFTEHSSHKISNITNADYNELSKDLKESQKYTAQKL